MSYDTDTCPKWTDHPMFDLHPSVLEVQAAKNVFMKEFQKNQRYTRYQQGSVLYMSPETVIVCALAEVWRQGRKYQRDITEGKQEITARQEAME